MGVLFFAVSGCAVGGASVRVRTSRVRGCCRCQAAVYEGLITSAAGGAVNVTFVARGYTAGGGLLRNGITPFSTGMYELVELV